jgi:hypothetical protein
MTATAQRTVVTRGRIITGLVILAVIAVLAALTAAGGNDVTKTRLQSSLAPTFANLYVQQAAILGHAGVTVASIDAHASCDKGGPKVADVGPGADWICMMTFHDQAQQLQNGKFELQVHSNSCYTAGGPSKIVGLLTITDTHGNDVDNPVFEFDGCFDPHS